MIDFAKLSSRQVGKDVIEPHEIFNRLPKPQNIDDLHTSQAEALDEWYKCRTTKDTVIKLNTGGGKTLVGLLIAVSSARELGRGALYLVDNRQLAQQVFEQAISLGIPASIYEGRQSLTSSFQNGETVLIAPYQALFNGRSTFGLAAAREPEDVSVIVVDDAHSSFDKIREAFTTVIRACDDIDLFKQLASLFRRSFVDIDRGSTFDDFLSGAGSVGDDVLEVPFWAWLSNLHDVAQLISERARSANGDDATSQSIRFNWPLIMDDLKYCRAIVSKESFSITPIIPFVDKFPTFIDAPRRVYMSATFADESAIVRSFGCRYDNLHVIMPRTLAGVGRRMILEASGNAEIMQCLTVKMKAVAQLHKGVVILAPSFPEAEQWESRGAKVVRAEKVESEISKLRQCQLDCPVVFANRYNGVDLPGDSCRLLIISGIPKAISDYQKLISKTLSHSRIYARSIAQRIDQAIGRGTRGSGDYCVVVLAERDLCEWIKDRRHLLFIDQTTRAQIQCGETIMKEVSTPEEFVDVIDQGINDDPGFASYLTNYVADNIGDAVHSNDEELVEFASKERKAVTLWRRGLEGKAVTILEGIASSEMFDDSIKGVSLQLAAQVAYSDGDYERARQLQQRAHGLNRALVKAKVPVAVPSKSLQAQKVLDCIEALERSGKDALASYDSETGSIADQRVSTGFEMAIEALGKYLGVFSKRFDNNGTGPDVLWVFEGENLGLVIEAKSDKNDNNPFTKKEHGQLLVAREWFLGHYPNMRCVPVSVHPNSSSYENASAESTYVLTLDALRDLQKTVRLLIAGVAALPRGNEVRLSASEAFLDDNNLRGVQFISKRLQNYKSIDHNTI